jgi:hypothetical protein
MQSPGHSIPRSSSCSECVISTNLPWKLFHNRSAFCCAPVSRPCARKPHVQHDMLYIDMDVHITCPCPCPCARTVTGTVHAHDSTEVGPTNPFWCVTHLHSENHDELAARIRVGGQMRECRLENLAKQQGAVPWRIANAMEDRQRQSARACDAARWYRRHLLIFLVVRHDERKKE